MRAVRIFLKSPVVIIVLVILAILALIRLGVFDLLLGGPMADQRGPTGTGSARRTNPKQDDAEARAIDRSVDKMNDILARLTK